MHLKILPQSPTICHPRIGLVSLATACHGPARQILKRPGSNASISLASSKSCRRCDSSISHLLSASIPTLSSFFLPIDAANFRCSVALSSQAVYFPRFSEDAPVPWVGFSLSVALHLVLYQYLLSLSDIPCRAPLLQDISNLVRSSASQRKLASSNFSISAFGTPLSGGSRRRHIAQSHNQALRSRQASWSSHHNLRLPPVYGLKSISLSFNGFSWLLRHDPPSTEGVFSRGISPFLLPLSSSPSPPVNVGSLPILLILTLLRLIFLFHALDLSSGPTCAHLWPTQRCCGVIHPPFPPLQTAASMRSVREDSLSGL